MCLLLYYLNPAAAEDEFYLILVNVRDEVYTRPTKYAHFWNQHEDVIGGVDAEQGKEGGTWFAMSKTGKIAALLNVLQPDDEIAVNKKGRGFLVVDYVTGDEDCLQYLQKISSEKDSYNGFTLVTMDISSLKSPKIAYFSNMSSLTPTVVEAELMKHGDVTIEVKIQGNYIKPPRFHMLIAHKLRGLEIGNFRVHTPSGESGKPGYLKGNNIDSKILGDSQEKTKDNVKISEIDQPLWENSGIHAFGNSTSVDYPWPKVIKAKEKFTEIVKKYSSISSKDVLIESLFHLLSDPTCYKLDENMKRQGRSKTSDFMDKLSCIYVHIPECNYGSRCHTIVLIDGSGKVDYFERSRCSETNTDWKLQHFTYELKSNVASSS